MPHGNRLLPLKIITEVGHMIIISKWFSLGFMSLAFLLVSVHL